MADNIYTVSQITKSIRAELEGSFSDVWVEGEISNFKVYPSGHAYFSLKDSGSLLNCVMFKSSASKLKFEAEDGMKMLCRGRISVYDKRGQYQLYVSGMEPKGQGALQAAFEKLKKKLFEEGLFDEEHKKEIPALPLRVGVVTSSAGAAIRDILNVARRRYSNCHITLVPVTVQGDGAKEEIAEAIKDLNRYNEIIASGDSEEHPIDVMIVGRGGGSLEDLWAFNEEIVARAIFSSKIPVISAVGHEVDYTISDFVADLRAATPSAAAELSVPLKEELEEDVLSQRKRLYTAAKHIIRDLTATVKALRESYVLREPTNVIKQLGQQVDELVRTISASMKHTLEIRTRDLAMAAGKLDALSPLAVLERGYSIVFKDGKAVKNAGALKKGDTVQGKLARGGFTGTIDKVQLDPEEK